jgi:nucleotide-binding universal stress UspA family protein
MEPIAWLALEIFAVSIFLAVKAKPFVVVVDFPAVSIVRSARSHMCAMILGAPQGQGGLSHVLQGSQTQKVVAMAKIRVLVHR